jgi:hypothetical protein
MTTGTVDVIAGAVEVRSEALTWPERAKTTVITDGVTYTAACELLKGIKALRAKIGETFDPHIKRAFDAHRALVKERSDAEAPLTEAEGILKRSLVTYDTEQERARQQEQRRLQEEARKQEEARRIDEAAALEREAAATGAEDLRVEAEALMCAPVSTPAVIAPRTTPKVAGISYREVWSARVVSLWKLILYVAAHPECANYLTPNTAALNAAVRGQKAGFKVDGVQAVCEKVAAASGR